jgi:L-fuculokinase
MKPRIIAALDVGKTHARLQLLDVSQDEPIWSSHCDNGQRSVDGLRELDIARIEAWLIAALATATRQATVDVIVPVAHGAAAVLIDAAGAVVAAPDYEDPAFERVADSYRPLRDAFSTSFSPFLPLGLNLGRQWHFLQCEQPPRHARVQQALLYPQYWAWRLCGTAASEVTSLGCHTDLWRPLQHDYSELAARQGWSRWLPPLRGAHEVLGSVLPAVAARTGLPASCQVLCGIHDSNASYLCHLAARPDGQPFAVISSGTWTVILANGAPLARLRESSDMLANVDARGAAVATARFMGGREFAAIASAAAGAVNPEWPVFERLLTETCLALPAFAPGGGPFAGRQGRIDAPRALLPAELWALATLYVVLMCDLQLDALDTRGSVIVDGPLSGNARFAPLLAALRPGSRVSNAAGSAGAAQAARILCGQPSPAAGMPVAPAPVDATALNSYRAHWRQLILATHASA